MNGPYSFSSKPRAVQQTGKGKGYRDGPRSKANYSNLMHDRRVVRGNTYSSQVLTANAIQEAEKFRMEQEKENRRRQRISEKQRLDAAPRSPPPVPGRKHADIQTEQYLEVLKDRVIETEAETQTEPFMDAPPEPLFMPAMTGIHVSTQVDVDELFDFDLEVEPILEVLVGKTLEHAMMEVLEEEELESIKHHQMLFDQERNARLAEVQRLEEAEKRRVEEKERRLVQERERAAKENDIRQKVEARTFAKTYLENLHSSVFEKLLEAGHFYDPIVKEIKQQFLPWVAETAHTEVCSVDLSRKLMEFLIAETLRRTQKKWEVKVQEAKEKKESEEAEAKAAAEAQAEGVEEEGIAENGIADEE